MDTVSNPYKFCYLPVPHSLHCIFKRISLIRFLYEINDIFCFFLFGHLSQVLIHMGFLTEESGDVFSPKVLKGGPLGEMVQWADILSALHVLGHDLKISLSVKELHG